MDLNHDGITDVLPKINLAKSEDYFTDLGGLKTRTGFIRFGMAPPEVRRRSRTETVVVCTDPHARFYVPKTTLSFAPGQKVQAINDQGRLDETFELVGIAMEFKEGEKKIDIQHFGYGTYKGRIIEVPLDHLRWVVGNSDIIDPERLHAGEAPRNIAENLLKPLFQEVAQLQHQFPGDIQKTNRQEQLNRLLENWEKTALTLDPGRTEELMRDPVWTGIEHTLAQLAGLTPAGFPG